MAAKKKTTRKKKVAKKGCRGIETKIHAQDVADYFVADGGLKNPRHEIFCQVWIQTFDFRQAIDQAGMMVHEERAGKDYASIRRELMLREEIRIRMRTILDERVKELAIDANWVVKEMFETYMKCIEQKPIMDKEGEVLGYEYQDLRTAMSTLEKLGQNIGMFQKQPKATRPVILNLNYLGEQPALPPPGAIEGLAKRLN